MHWRFEERYPAFHEEILLGMPGAMMGIDFFDSAYKGTSPGDIGRPEMEFAELAMRGEITGFVQNPGVRDHGAALIFAGDGHEEGAIDSAPRQSGKQERRLPEEDSKVHFLVVNTPDLQNLTRKFNAATDPDLSPTLS
jgi:hypothetical protein